MSEKLLVADDSPTIQKVVGITLANSDYELVQAQSEEEMLGLLESDDFDLVLLDFNLSEEKDGYELCSDVRSKSPNVKIMIMLGTFDSVDDDRIEELGVVEKVIKPFESSKFTQKIKDALEAGSSNQANDFDLSSSTYDLGDDDSDEDSDEEDSEWTISGPTLEEGLKEENDDGPMPEGNFLEQANNDNELASELTGWGMSVPGVINGEESSDSLMPPQMAGADNSSQVSTNDLSDSNSTGEWDAAELLGEDSDSLAKEVLPDEDDLDYPVIGDVSEAQGPGPSSSLVSLDELSGNDEDDEELEDTDPQIIIAQQEDDPTLEKEIDGELEPDEFWAADDSYDISEEEEQDSIKIEALEEGDTDSVEVEKHTPIEVGPKLEEDESHHPTVEALNELSSREEELKEVGPKLEQVDPSKTSASLSGIDKSEIIASLKEEIRPMVKEIVQEVIAEMGRETSEKVAWEIIPDLAENLIRTEVERLSQKVQEKHSLS
jgi:CheY-like chemotaxis protein